MAGPYYDPPSTDANADIYSRVAAGYVQDLAPTPDPETNDYMEKAEAAEFMVYNHIKATGGGLIKSQSARGLSGSYVDIAQLESLIRPVMGSYFTGSAASLGYLEATPW